jgi:hypothetical protein
MLAWTKAAEAELLDLRRRALAPVPEPVGQFWSDVLGAAFEEARPDYEGRAASVEQTVSVTWPQLRDRWPVCPLLVPSSPRSERSTWVLLGVHHRFAISRVVGVSLLWLGGDAGDFRDYNDRPRLLNNGAVLFRQSVSWTDPEATHDPPNTVVRDQPAHFTEFSLEANNEDALALGWREPISSGAPRLMPDLWCSAEAHPRHHTVDDIRRFIDELRTAI